MALKGTAPESKETLRTENEERTATRSDLKKNSDPLLAQNEDCEY